VYLGDLVLTRDGKTMNIAIYSDNINIGTHHYRYADKPNQWYETEELFEHLDGINKPFAEFIDTMFEKDEQMQELTIHNLTWAGPTKQKSFRFMNATVKSTAVSFPFLYTFRGRCVFVLPILHETSTDDTGNNVTIPLALTCEIKKGAGWQRETFAGMCADQETGTEEDVDITPAIAELREELGAVFYGLQVRRVGPPAAMSIGGCDEWGSPFVADMAVTPNFVECIKILTSQYKDEKFRMVVEPLHSMVLDDSKKALCYAGWLRNRPAAADICTNGLDKPVNKSDLIDALNVRVSELIAEGNITDSNALVQQIGRLQDV
jgi:hypothetical protein